MITAVHIEDEPRNIELLKELVKEHCREVELIGNAQNVSDALNLITKLRPQLLYLDIELNKGNAFELLEQLIDLRHQFHVVFITAFNEYATKAFRYNAIDYLLKPISITELKEATARAVERIKLSEDNRGIFEVLKEIKNNAGSLKIGLPVSDGLVFEYMDDIVKCEAKGSYSVLYFKNKKSTTCSITLKHLEEMLTSHNFLRVHNSWIINRRYLKKYYRGKNSYIEMEDGTTVAISIRKKADLLSLLKDFE